MWQNNGYGMDVMETRWDDVEMMKRGTFVPGVKSPFESTAVERWQRKSTQDSAASLARAF